MGALGRVAVAGVSSYAMVSPDGQLAAIPRFTYGTSSSFGLVFMTEAPMGKPDLTALIDYTKLPSSVLPTDKKNGTIQSVPVMLLNEGDKANTAASIVVQLYASSDTTLGAGDTLLGSMTFTGSLPAGWGTVLTFKKIVVPELPAGNYYLLANVDSTNVVSEVSEANVFNSINKIQWLQPTRDLTGTIDAKKVPLTVAAGSLIKLPVKVRNGGNVAVTSTIVIDIYASTDQTLGIGDILIGTASVTLKLGANGSTKTVNLTFTAPALASKSYYLLANIDATNVVSETNESNNVAVSPGTVLWT